MIRSRKQKLDEVIETSNLPTLLAPFKPYFHQVGLNSKYYTENYLNTARLKYKNNEFSIFHLTLFDPGVFKNPLNFLAITLRASELIL